MSVVDAHQRSLPVVVSDGQEDACCAACAAQGPKETRTPRVIRRADDRTTTYVGLLIAGGFVALAAGSGVSTMLGGSAAPWTALHLLLAGAAGTAIASVLPFFTAALAQVAPVRREIRIGAIGLVAGSALVVNVAVAAQWLPLAGIGGCVYVIGIGLVAVAAFLPLRDALGTRTGLVPTAYAFGLMQVAVGVSVATAFVLGWGPVVSRWIQLKPAHAWLNVFGFLSIIIAATLLHLAPTVAGTRIRRGRVTTIMIASMVAGPPLVALGFASGSDSLTRLGAMLEIVGAVALVIQAVTIHRARARWTSDRSWHRFTTFSLAIAPWWFAVAVAIASGRILASGAAPEAWSVALIGVPLALGWTAQALIGSWTHLVPAIGPGDQQTHRLQRQWLGRWGEARVVAWNVAVAALTLGILARVDPLAWSGAFVLAGLLVVAIVLLAGSVTVGRSHVVPIFQHPA